MSASRDVRKREMPGGRGEDERNMFAEELIAMRNQRGWAQEEIAAKMPALHPHPQGERRGALRGPAEPATGRNA
jgi:hypothetical protein